MSALALKLDQESGGDSDESYSQFITICKITSQVSFTPMLHILGRRPDINNLYNIVSLVSSSLSNVLCVQVVAS